MHTDPTTQAPAAGHVYVIHLRAACTAELQGRMEHVASGRRHDFDSGQGLLDCLRQEEAQVARERAPATDGGRGVPPVSAAAGRG